MVSGFDILMDISDHTGTLQSCFLSATVAEKTLGCTVSTGILPNTVCSERMCIVFKFTVFTRGPRQRQYLYLYLFNQQNDLSLCLYLDTGMEVGVLNWTNVDHPHGDGLLLLDGLRVGEAGVADVVSARIRHHRVGKVQVAVQALRHTPIQGQPQEVWGERKRQREREREREMEEEGGDRG